jgi:ribonuclease P/MRP protein subunit POP5
MNRVPIKDGKNCVFQVLRVSGTMRKAEQEAIRRARDIILQARQDTERNANTTLDSIFGKDQAEEDATDLLMVDRSDDEEDELSDGND